MRSTSPATSSVIAASSWSRCFMVMSPWLDHRAEQDLDVDLVVGAVDAGRVVDEVGVDPAALLGEDDARALGQAEIAALADHPAAQLLGVDPDRVVGAIERLGMALARRP